MKKLLPLISTLISTFNKKNNLDLQIFIKGSYLFWARDLISRMPNDLDFGFMNCSFTQRTNFIEFLLKNNFEVIKRDENLQILRYKNFLVEFIILETINKSFLEETQYKNIHELNFKYAFFQKTTMIGYVLDPVYTHDVDKKILNIIEDLNFCWNLIPTRDEFLNYEKEIKFLQNSLWNSFFIYWYYNYDRMLDKYFSFEKLEKYTQFLDNSLKIWIQNFLVFIKDKFKANLNFFDEILKKRENFTKLLNNFLIFPSLPGFEKQYVKKLFGETINTETNGVFLSKNSTKNNVLFISHTDEVGGIVVNGEVYNQGTPYWENGVFEVYNQNSEKINEIFCEKLNNFIYSEEKIRKINRPTLSCNNLNKDEIYQIFPKSDTKVSKFDISSRNLDNKISNILLRILLTMKMEKSINILLTTKEEIQLQGIKDFTATNEIKKYKFLINLDVNQDKDWDQEGVRIRIADQFTAVNMPFYNKIRKLFEKNAIPFLPYFGSGSTDITNFQNKNAITLSISASKIHSNSSFCLLKNFFFLLWMCKEINENLS